MQAVAERLGEPGLRPLLPALVARRDGGQGMSQLGLAGGAADRPEDPRRGDPLAVAGVRLATPDVAHDRLTGLGPTELTSARRSVAFL